MNHVHIWTHRDYPWLCIHILVGLAGFAISRVFFNGFGYRTLNHRWRER
jgi:hypothetical protein